MPDLGRWLTPDPAGFTDGMNLYDFVHNEPLIHFDEYGLWLERRPPGTFNSSEIMQTWGHQYAQFRMGCDQGVINAGFGALQFLNTLVHKGMNPVPSVYRSEIRYNSCIGNSYDSFSSINHWLDQKQGIINDVLFPGRNESHLTHRSGNFIGNFLTDTVMFGGGYRLFRGARNIFNSASSFLPKLNSINQELAFVRGAENVNSAVSLQAKLSGLQKAQKSAVRVRNLSDGRIRYYSLEVPASKQGITRGTSYVTEWNPNSGQVRSWMESCDHFGQVNRVHPKMINGQTLDSIHYPPIGREIGIK